MVTRLEEQHDEARGVDRLNNRLALGRRFPKPFDCERRRLVLAGPGASVLVCKVCMPWHINEHTAAFEGVSQGRFASRH